MPERLMNVEKYCLARSWRLRRCRGYTRYLIRNALCYLPPKPPYVADPAEWRELLRVNLEAKIRQDYRNPVIIFILIQIILPIVIRLIVEWWLNRRKSPRMDSRKAAESIRKRNQKLSEQS